MTRHSQSSKEQTSFKERNSNRGQNWSVPEDEQLCRSWLQISTDPIDGRSQKGEDLWNSITLDFSKPITDVGTTRSTMALMSRWTVIQNRVSKFCDYYQQVQNSVQFKASNAAADMVNRAYSMYRNDSDGKKSFNLHHCWVILRDSPKWIQHIQDKSAKMAVTRRPRDVVDVIEDFEHPISCKKLPQINDKRARADVVLDVLKNIAADNQKKLKLLEKNMELELLQVDLSKLKNPRIRDFFEREQNELLDKHDKVSILSVEDLDDIVEEIAEEVDEESNEEIDQDKE